MKPTSTRSSMRSALCAHCLASSTKTKDGTNKMAGIEDLYREIILDHYRSPRNRGELPAPPAQRVEGFNPLCGDEVVVYVQVQDGTVTDIRFAGQGCSISQSSASLMS